MPMRDSERGIFDRRRGMQPVRDSLTERGIPHSFSIV